jgi:hypothetical protein
MMVLGIDPGLDGAVAFGELIVDNFAGGGGTSTGLEAGVRPPGRHRDQPRPRSAGDARAEPPATRCTCARTCGTSTPSKVTGNQPVGLVWLSPDCKHFSKAKGGTPVEKKIRGLAWVTLRWVAKCKPRVVMLENVEEFQEWGPLIVDADGNARPDPAKKGKTFDSFVRQLRAARLRREAERNARLRQRRADDPQALLPGRAPRRPADRQPGARHARQARQSAGEEGQAEAVAHGGGVHRLRRAARSIFGPPEAARATTRCAASRRALGGTC